MQQQFEELTKLIEHQAPNVEAKVLESFILMVQKHHECTKIIEEKHSKVIPTLISLIQSTDEVSERISHCVSTHNSRMLLDCHLPRSLL